MVLILNTLRHDIIMHRCYFNMCNRNLASCRIRQLIQHNQVSYDNLSMFVGGIRYIILLYNNKFVHFQHFDLMWYKNNQPCLKLVTKRLIFKTGHLIFAYLNPKWFKCKISTKHFHPHIPATCFQLSYRFDFLWLSQGDAFREATFPLPHPLWGEWRRR